MRHDLSSLAEAELQALEADGVHLTPHDIVHVCALAERVENPVTMIGLARGRPVSIGGAVLWPMTLAAEDWWDSVGCRLGNDVLGMFALGYAMANGHESLPYEPDVAKAAVYKWYNALKCTPGMLVEAIDAVRQQHDTLPVDDADSQDATSAGEISAMLAAATRTNPQVWEFQCSIPYVLRMLEIIVAQDSAEGLPPQADPRIRADRALGLCVHRIRERHKREAGTDGD